jgi:DnaK suppressor protein
MNKAHAHLDAAFIEKKRLELIRLRDALRKSADAARGEEEDVKDAAAGQSREYEDDAQKLQTLEQEGLLVDRTVERLTLVERALARIEAGTYGFSEVSGKPIPIERLNAVPEAATTVGEQAANERAG